LRQNSDSPTVKPVEGVLPVAVVVHARGVARAAGFTWERTARLTLDAYAEALAMP